MEPRETPAGSLCVEIPGGVRVCVPDDPNRLTTYVLLEQEDWFEDEIRFIRCFLEPGMRVLDIGANYGVYALTAASLVGHSGFVWAFEPSESCRHQLRTSLQVNQFSHVVIDARGVSDRIGFAHLALLHNTELGSIEWRSQDDRVSVEVPMTTLDTARTEYSWGGIDFVKIDAEGQESSILKGGRQFFTDASPLVMYEHVHAGKVNATLREDFAALGYQSYRLVPALNVLAPVTNRPDDVRGALNLFACKSDTACKLARRGLLVTGMANFTDVAVGDWRRELTVLPYGRVLTPLWADFAKANASSPQWLAYERLLNRYLGTWRSELDAATKYAALRLAYEGLRGIVSRDGQFSSLMSFARVALDYGMRADASIALDAVARLLSQGGAVDVPGPFLAPSRRFDAAPAAGGAERWVLCSVLETLEECAGYSSYFTGESALPRIQAFRAIGCCSAAMERRWQLLRMRLGLQQRPEPVQVLSEVSDGHRNVAYWRDR